uniref:BZIP domain-containing protein n=1 Tax=Panagrolaimus sp. JU765 TaxID=591449 RepID=A0AC34Q2J8_9BILA
MSALICEILKDGSVISFCALKSFGFFASLIMSFNNFTMASANSFAVNYNQTRPEYENRNIIWSGPEFGRPHLGMGAPGWGSAPGFTPKTSVAFVEPNMSIDEDYGQGLSNMELNKAWHQQNYSDTYFNQNPEGTTPIFNEQFNYHDVSKSNNTEMEYSSAPSDEPSMGFSMDDFAQFYQENPHLDDPVTDNMEVNGRKSVGSEYSCSSGDSYGEASSRTTELSQEEIFEEIQRECAEIERRSTSPMASTRKTTRRGTTNRKKELNRVAAAKYREKKRLERESRQDELKHLESRNRTLKTQVSSLENEINYLRELIGEIRTRQ